MQPTRSPRAATGQPQFARAPRAGCANEASVYKPSGEQVETVTATQLAPETKGWIGERYDADAGLQYLNARYYDPELGMFIQPDWWEVTKAGVGTNRFAYSFGDPVNKMDPGGNLAASVEEASERDKLQQSRADSSSEVKTAQQTTGSPPTRGRPNSPTQEALTALVNNNYRQIDALRAELGLPPQARISGPPGTETGGQLVRSRQELESLRAARNAALQPLTSNALTNQIGPNGYPANNGALSGWVEVQLTPGTMLSRYGQPSGAFISPLGVPDANRSLPPSNSREHHTYRVEGNITVRGSVVAPAYGEPGGGIQYMLSRPVSSYLKSGEMTEVFP